MTGLNRHLRGLRDGERVSSCWVACHHGTQERRDGVRVCWPFVVFKERHPTVWNVTHALTGCNLGRYFTLKGARASIAALRASGADWEFSSSKSLKAYRAKHKAGGLIDRVWRVS